VIEKTLTLPVQRSIFDKFNQKPTNMKKLILLFFAMALLVAGAIAQVPTPALNPDGTVIQQANSLLDFFAVFGALLPLVVSITAFLVYRFTMNKTSKQITAWLIAIALTFLGWWMQIGYLTEITWWMALIHGFALGLAANGFFDIAMIKAILTFLFPPKRK